MATEDRALPTYSLGYAIDKEQTPLMMANGVEPEWLLRKAEDSNPQFNPVVHPGTLFNPLNQANQGACQGHSLALIFTICYFLMLGRIEFFSRAAAYYLSQRKDGIRGDQGSTLSAGQWVATQHGLCLESDWRYPSHYMPAEPSGINYRFKLVAAKPTRDWELIRRALDLGLPVQDGIPWNDEVSRTICTRYTGSRAQGGHSTTLWTKSEGGLYRRINSWDMWDGDGCNENTPEALQSQVEHRQSSHVIYAPEGMIYPELNPVNFA